jgi:hypothetical protein
VSLRPLTSGPSHFFGFHDLTPWNAHTDELVCLRTTTSEDHVPTHADEAEVVVVNEADGRETVVGRTRAWNWQKGARQRWLPALGRRVIAYNACNATGFECRIADLDAGTERALPLALYDICDHAGFGLTLNFSRLVKCQPGYGYDHPLLSGERGAGSGAQVPAQRPLTPPLSPDGGEGVGSASPLRFERGEGQGEVSNSTPGSPLPAPGYSSDGITRVDLATGETRLILSIADFLRARGLAPALGEHYFTHLQISPDGKRCVFMHRCFLKSGGLVNHFIVANTDGSGFRVLLDDKMSHFDWSDNDHVLVWCRKNTAIKKLKESKLLAVARALYRLSRKIRINAVRQGLYNESFREIDVNTGESVAVGKGVLPEDGHPQVNPRHPGLWVNDTYPNPEHVQTLMLYHQPTNRRVDLVRLPTQPAIQETCWRCDFHPRWHPNGERVCVDSAHLGRRQLCVVDVKAQVAAFLHHS